MPTEPSGKRDNPPSDWFPNVQRIGNDDAFLSLGATPAESIVWHWCEGAQPRPRWEGAQISNHTIVQREPVTIRASLACRHCSWHGFITDGEWSAA